MTTLRVIDSLKMLRETLCVAQTRIGNSPYDEDRKREHIDRLQRLLDECDRYRPLSKYGNWNKRGLLDYYTFYLVAGLVLGFILGKIL